MEKIQEKTPLNLKQYLTIFNQLTINEEIIEKVFEEIFQLSRSVSRKDNNSFLIEESSKEEKKINVFSGIINYSQLFVTQSSFCVIRGIMDRVLDFIFFDSLIVENYFQIFLLFDFFIFSFMEIFTDKKIIQLFSLEIDLEDVKKNEKYSYASEILYFQEKYFHLRKFYLETKKKLEDLFQKNNKNNFKNLEFYLPKLINKNDTTEITYFNQTLLSMNSIKSVYEIIKKLIHFTEKIEFDFQKEEIIETINEYENIISELENSVYKKLCHNIVNVNKIKEMSLSVNWNISESLSEKLLFEPSPFVKFTVEELKNIYNNIKDKLLKFNKQIEEEFISQLIKFIIQNIQESISRIPKCSKPGRSIMLKDVKYLQKGFGLLIKEWNYNININEAFKLIFDYVNVWYSPTDDLFNFIFDNVRYIYLFFRNYNINIIIQS